jgi:uncharacterized protein (TIGR02271 family)
MTTGRNAEDYSGRIAADAEVYGSDNEKIGHVAEVGAHYFMVQKGSLFTKDLYLPTSSIARVHEGHVHLDITKQQAETMGREELPTENDAWYGSATRTAGYETAETRTASRAATAGTTMREGEDISVPVVEEQLKAGVREKEAGTARIVKEVRAERQTIDVPVQHDEVYVTERAVNRPATDADLAMRDREIDIPLTKQEVVAQKEAVVTGEVSIRKETVADTERVTDTVRRESVHVEGADSARVHTEGTGMRRGTGSGGGKTVTDTRQYDAQGNLVDETERVDEGPNRPR